MVTPDVPKWSIVANTNNGGPMIPYKPNATIVYHHCFNHDTFISRAGYMRFWLNSFMNGMSRKYFCVDSNPVRLGIFRKASLNC